MHIIVAGCGKLGLLIAEQLVAEKHDVSIIDRDQTVIDKYSETLDALTFKGSCVSIDTLMEADIKHADVLIATTISDETNMLCCLIGKKYGAKYTIARIRDHEYLDSVNVLTRELHIDSVINPERAAAREINRMLRLPFVSGIETFARGRVEAAQIRVSASDCLVNIPLNRIYMQLKAMPRVLFSAIERGDEAIIPKGDTVIREGDNLFITAAPATLTEFFRFVGKNTKEAKDALIIGGSRIAYYLVKLLNESKVKSVLIELDEEKARQLDEELEHTDVIHGDGTDNKLLLSVGLKTRAAFIALTDRDEENIMAGLYAKHISNGYVIIKNNRTNYDELLNGMGVDSIICPAQIACNDILRVVRARQNTQGTSVERMYRIMGGKAEALEFIAQPGSHYLNRPLSDLKVDAESIVAVIVHEKFVKVPFGSDIIQEYDRVIIITRRAGILDLADVLS